MSNNESPIEDLGNARIDAGRLSVPSELFEWDVLSEEGDAYWAYDGSTDRLILTMSERSLDERGGYTRVGSTAVSDDGELTLPEELLAEGDERPWTGYFVDDDACYFASTVDLLGEKLCYALTERRRDAFWNE